MSSRKKGWLAFGLLGLLLLAGCREKGAQLQSSATPPDKELFKNGTEWLEKSQFLKARLAYQTLINTYPDSELTPKAFIGIADSYYNEGGREALLQAEAQYKDFIVFYPTHEKTAEAQLRIAALNMKMMEAPDRDPTYSRRAETELKRFLDQFPESPLRPEIQDNLKRVQDVLARGEYDKGQFYYRRRNYKAARSRYEDIVRLYPKYGGMDTVLYELADSLLKLERPEEAAKYATQLAQGYDGPKAEAAKKMLTELNKPIPPVDTTLVALHAEQRPAKEPLLRNPLSLAKAAFTSPDPYREILERSAERRGISTAVESDVAVAKGPVDKDKAQIEGTIVLPKSGNPSTGAVAPVKSGTPPADSSNSNSNPAPSVTGSGTTGNSSSGEVKTAPNDGKPDPSRNGDAKAPKKKRGLLKKILRTG